MRLVIYCGRIEKIPCYQIIYIEYLPHLKLMRDMKPMPILVLSPQYNTSEKLEAIQLGADEYLAG